MNISIIVGSNLVDKDYKQTSLIKGAGAEKLFVKSRQKKYIAMNKDLMENFLLSELAEVKGGLSTKDCVCTSGAGQYVVISSMPDGGSIEDSGDGTIGC